MNISNASLVSILVLFMFSPRVNGSNKIIENDSDIPYVHKLGIEEKNIIEDEYNYFYIYKDSKINLKLNTSTIAVQYTDGQSRIEGLSENTQQSLYIKSEKFIEINNWNHLELSKEIDSPNNLYNIVKKLQSLTDIAFVSPIFYGNFESSWLCLTPDIIIKINDDFFERADEILLEIAPDLEVKEYNFGNMPGVYLLRTRNMNGIEVLNKANVLALNQYIDWAEPDMIFSGRGSNMTASPDSGLKVFSGYFEEDWDHLPAPEKNSQLHRQLMLSSDLYNQRNAPMNSNVNLIPNDPLFPFLWGIRSVGQFGAKIGLDIDGDSAWNVTTGSADIKILVIDVGVQQDHPDINQLPGADFTGVGGTGGPDNECDNQGTNVAGCITGIINNSIGIAGVSPNCKVISAKTFNASLSCNSSWTTQVSWTVNALAFGESQGCRVSCNSNEYSFQSSSIDAIYASTYANGMVHFSMAGFTGGGPPVKYPGSIPEVNAVSSINMAGDIASDYGTGVSVTGPGSWIYTTDRTGTDGLSDGDYNYFYVSGPPSYTAGIAALILSQEPSLSPSQVEEKIQCSATDIGDPGYDDMFGYGLINSYKAVSAFYGVDSDIDGVDDVCDNCPDISNASQQDSDYDNIGDDCDICPNDPTNDIDSDGICEDIDNCPSIPNPDQADSNSDGVGDACECISPYFKFYGESANDYFGFFVNGAGDINNDGFDDLIVGARLHDGPGTNTGEAYVYSGVDGSLLYTKTGECCGGQFGSSVAGGYDFDSDGYDDFIIGARTMDAPFFYEGKVYVYSGQTGNTIYTFNGISYDYLGVSVSGLDDVNNDDIPDILAGSYGGNGRARIYSGATGDLLYTFYGESQNDLFGYSVAEAGDVDNDGVSDIIVGAPYNDFNGTNSGRAYVYSGADGSLLHTLTGEAAFDNFGFNVSGAGDIDGDNHADFIIGAPSYTGDSAQGRAYVYSGIDGSIIHIFTGDVIYGYFGFSVSGGADIDNDNVPDIVVGEIYADRAHIFSGQTGATILTIQSEASGDYYGRHLAFTGDINGDNVNDLIVGAMYNDNTDVNAGSAYVYLLGDADDDGVCSAVDNCPNIYNPDQSDVDEDGKGDVCDCCVGFRGNVDGDENDEINIADLVYFVNYSFGVPSGPEPPCIEEADVDASGELNIADIVYMVNYMFGTPPGPAPLECP